MAYLPAYAFVRRLGLMVAIALFAPQAPAADKIPRETFGAESNPTGNPIGGGSGYQRPLAEPNYRVATADELLSALGQARAGEVVYVDDARQIDLTDQRGIVIPGGVTLASGRGQNDSPGALLFTTEDKDTKGAARESFCLFKTGGSGARVTGLRLRGPDPRRRVQYDYLNSNGILAKHDGLEVDNCEIYAWSHAGVFVQAGTDFHIHHNFIHHTRRLGLGYGVSIDRAEVLIEANIFDYSN